MLLQPGADSLLCLGLHFGLKGAVHENQQAVAVEGGILLDELGELGVPPPQSRSFEGIAIARGCSWGRVLLGGLVIHKILKD